MTHGRTFRADDPGAAPRWGAVTVTELCTACGACLPTCPERAIRVDIGGRPPLRVLDSCTGCLECVEVCPADAIATGGQERR